MFYENSEIINIASERREIAISNTVRIEIFFQHLMKKCFMLHSDIYNMKKKFFYVLDT